jgi:septum formation protein
MQACQQINPNDSVLCADTTVALNKTVLGKPETAQNNAAMLAHLQGQTHRVITAVALRAQGSIFQTISISYVTFASLTRSDIERYANSAEGWDKAGGYAIQGEAGAFIAHMRGNYTGIVGLPLHHTRLLLKQAGLLASD